MLVRIARAFSYSVGWLRQTPEKRMLKVPRFSVCTDLNSDGTYGVTENPLKSRKLFYHIPSNACCKCQLI